MTYQVLCRRVDERREGEISGEDFLVYAEGVGVVVRGVSDEHFVGENAEGPPVDCFSVAVGTDDFGGEVLGCSADGPGSIGTSF